MQIHPEFFRFTDKEGILTSILDQVPVGILTFDENWKVNFINESFVKFGILYGYEFSALVGANIREVSVFPGVSVEPHLISLSEGYVFEKEIKVVNSLSNASLSLIVKGTPLFVNGNFKGGIIAVEDVKVLSEVRKEADIKYELKDLILKDLNDIIIISDSAGNIYYSSQQTHIMLGLDAAEISTTNLFDLFGTDAADNIKESFASVLDSREKKTFSFRYKDNDRSLVLECNVSIHSSKHVKPGLLLLILKDKTSDEEYRSRLQKETSEYSKYKNLLSASTDAFIEIDYNGEVITWSEGAAEYFETSGKDAEGKFVGDIINVFRKSFLTHALDQLRDTGSHSVRLSYQRKNNDTVIFDSNFIHLVDTSSIFILMNDVTTTVAAEKELRASESGYKAMILQSNELICSIDLEGMILYANPSFCSALKYSRAELTGKKLSDFIVDSNGIKENFSIENVLAEKSLKTNLILENKHGKHLYLRAAFSPIFDENRKLNSLSCILFDISGHRSSEKDLTIFRSLFEAAQDGFAVTKEGGIILCNDPFAEIFGYSSGKELHGSELLKLVSSNDVLKVAEYMQLVEQKKDYPGRFEFIGKRKDGSPVFTEMSMSYFEAEGVVYTVMIARDVTERKRAQQAIRDSEEKYRNITENIDDFLYTIERVEGKLRPVFYTSAVEKVTGYSQSDFLSDSRLFLKIVYPDDFAFVKRKIKNLLKNKIQLSEEFEFRLINKHGNIVWVRNKVNLNRNIEGAIQKIYGLVSDITLRKKAEEELKASTNDLVKLNETKDRFISIVSHDLRTPFSSILGFTDLLLSDDDLSEKEKTQYIRFIRESSKSMLALVNSLLDWTRLQTGRVKFDLERHDVKSLVESSINLLSGAAFQKDLVIESDTKKDFYVFVDKSLINQVLNNLISNAIKFSHRGSKIIISARPAEENRFIEISVKDFGLGIKPDNFKKLFGVDVKFTSEGTEGEKGSGLGLSLVNEIVQKHGGKIWVESQPGKGSDFRFTLPVASAHILLVDDSKTDRLLYSKILRNITTDYEIDVAENGKEAFEKIMSAPPALVITDHIMPEMTGYDLLLEIKKSDLKGKPPVIVLSSELDRQAIYDYNQLGVEYVFQKPVNLSNFKQAVEKSLKKGFVVNS